MDRKKLEPTRPRIRPLVPGAALAVVAVAVGLALAILLPGPTDVATPSPSRSSPSLAPSPSAAFVSPSPTPTVQPRPVWAIDLASHLICDGPPSTMGMDVPPVPGPFDPGETPDGALSNILLTYWNLPASGYAPVLVDGPWALHRYLVDGRPKVHVVSTNDFPDVPSETRWEVVGLRACDRSEFADAEFAPHADTIWMDAAGNPARTELITSSPGPGHCGWESTVFMSFDERQYIRDPKHVLQEYTVTKFDARSRIPEDAVDTGLHTEKWHLFTIPSGRAVFVKTNEGRVELWPRARELIGCA